MMEAISATERFWDVAVLSAIALISLRVLLFVMNKMMFYIRWALFIAIWCGIVTTIAHMLASNAAYQQARLWFLSMLNIVMPEKLFGPFSLSSGEIWNMKDVLVETMKKNTFGLIKNEL